MKQLFLSLILALLPCVSFAGPQGEAFLPETVEYYQKGNAHDRKASEHYMMEVPPAMYDYGDSVTVSGREYAWMQEVLHPDTLFDELGGMWERKTPLAHTACVIGIMLLILVALSIVIWLINFVIDGMCGLFERKKKGAPGCGSPSGRAAKVNPNDFESVKEEKFGSREDAEDSVFERAGYKLPFTGMSQNDYFFIRDSKGNEVVYGNFGITGDLLKRIVSLLNREPGVEVLPSGRLQISGSADNHINLLSPAGEFTGKSIQVNEVLDSGLIGLSGEMAEEIIFRLTGSAPETIEPVTSEQMAKSEDKEVDFFAGSPSAELETNKVASDM